MMESLAFSLTEDLLDYLNDKKSQGVSKSFIVRRALEQYRIREERKARRRRQNDRICQRCQQRRSA